MIGFLLRSILFFAALPCLAEEGAVVPVCPDNDFHCSGLLFSDSFDSGLGQWKAELEAGGRIEAKRGVLEVDVPGGCSLWFIQPLEGAVLISFEATPVAEGGPNDRVSDLNCFWMATDVRSPADLFATVRQGAFAEYDQLRCYYVGLGGNSNTSSRFRRYVGEPGRRPLLPEHDLSSKEVLLEANVPLRIQLVAMGPVIRYYRDGRLLFALEDKEPYTKGWFAFRTVKSHLRIRNFRIDRLSPAVR